MHNAKRFLSIAFAVGVFMVTFSIRSTHAASAGPSVSPADSLKMLLEGNDRFVNGKTEHPNQDAALRTRLASGQHPFACVLSCSDSRIPPEVIFDRGLGDLFVVRVAGNVVQPGGRESLQYAVAHLGPKLIVVLGHRNCGAVNAAVAGKTDEFPEIDAAILPAIVKTKNMPGDPNENAMVANVRFGVEKLSKWKPFAKLIKSGDLKIVGGVYNLHTGQVTLLDVPSSPAPQSEEGDADY